VLQVDPSLVDGCPTATHTDNRGCGIGYRDMWQLLCFRCLQVITADTVVAYITHDVSIKPARSEATWQLVYFIWQML